jgi:hypothetical protein
MGMHEYKPGEVIPVTSSLYRVVHNPPKEGEYLQTFYEGDQFPPCPECGNEVCYLIRVGLLRKKS